MRSSTKVLPVDGSPKCRMRYTAYRSGKNFKIGDKQNDTDK